MEIKQQWIVINGKKGLMLKNRINKNRWYKCKIILNLLIKKVIDQIHLN